MSFAKMIALTIIIITGFYHIATGEYKFSFDFVRIHFPLASFYDDPILSDRGSVLDQAICFILEELLHT